SQPGAQATKVPSVACAPGWETTGCIGERPADNKSLALPTDSNDYFLESRAGRESAEAQAADAQPLSAPEAVAQGGAWSIEVKRDGEPRLHDLDFEYCPWFAAGDNAGVTFRSCRRWRVGSAASLQNSRCHEANNAA